MGHLGIFVAALALLLVAAAANRSESNSTNTPPTPSTPSLPAISTTTPDSSNKTKDGLGEARYGHRRGNDHYGDRHGHRGGYRRRHDDYSSEEYDGYDIHHAKPYFDTHYCSVHGSFRLSYNEKVEKKEYENKDNYQKSGGYGQSAGGYGQNDGGYGQNDGGYGKPQGYGGKDNYGERSSYKKNRPHYVRKTTRQYCRYTAAHSEKACRFCCKVVARSAYTNPDDIIAAIFSFDPSNPKSGGAGYESYDHKEKSKEYDQSPAYGGQGDNYNNGGGNSYGGQQQYGGENQQYGGGNSYGGQQQSYSPPQYGNGPYRTKRDAYSPAPSYGPSAPAQSYDQYQQPGGEQYSDTPKAYEQKPDHGNKYENNVNAIRQCVCCAPKHKYY